MIFHDEVEHSIVPEEVEEGDNATVTNQAKEIGFERDRSFMLRLFAIRSVLPASHSSHVLRRDLCE